MSDPEMDELEIKIDKDGNVTLKVIDGQGERCLDLTRDLEEALGLGMVSCPLETEDSIKVLEEDFIKVLEEEEDSQVATADRRAASLALEVEGSQAVEAEAIPEDTSLEAGARAAMCPLRRG